MREDAPAPPRPPAKRKALERTLDRWLAIWAHDDALPESERERAQAERDRRKALRPEQLVGVVLDREGATPQQLETIKETLGKLRPTAIHHPWTTRTVAGVCRGYAKAHEVQVEVHRDLREVVLSSTVIVAVPRGQEDFRRRTPAWEAVHYARHRKLPITVVLPDGTVRGEA